MYLMYVTPPGRRTPFVGVSMYQAPDKYVIEDERNYIYARIRKAKVHVANLSKINLHAKWNRKILQFSTSFRMMYYVDDDVMITSNYFHTNPFLRQALFLDIALVLETTDRETIIKEACRLFNPFTPTPIFKVPKEEPPLPDLSRLSFYRG